MASRRARTRQPQNARRARVARQGGAHQANRWSGPVRESLSAALPLLLAGAIVGPIVGVVVARRTAASTG